MPAAAVAFTHDHASKAMSSVSRSTVEKHSVIIDGHKTSISLEEPFWNEVRAIAGSRRITVATLLRDIDGGRQNANLSSAIRVFVLRDLRERANIAVGEKSNGPSPPQMRIM
jgi:predicted DNA-binding ribbon-helix-helix protein